MAYTVDTTSKMTSTEASTYGLSSSDSNVTLATTENIATTATQAFNAETSEPTGTEVTTWSTENIYPDQTLDDILNNSVSATNDTESAEIPTAAYPSSTISQEGKEDITSSSPALTSDLPLTTHPPSTVDIAALAVGVGLGVALLVAIIIIVVLCVKLSRAKGEKQESKNVSSIKASKKDQYAFNNETEPNLEYSSTYSNYDINKSAINKESLYAPSSLYEYASYVGTTSIPQSNGINNASKKSKTPSVVHAIVNKVKPNRNVSTRNLANPCDDVVIVENDLYTADVGVGH